MLAEWTADRKRAYIVGLHLYAFIAENFRAFTLAPDSPLKVSDGVSKAWIDAGTAFVDAVRTDLAMAEPDVLDPTRSELYSGRTLDGGAIALLRWPEGYVLRYHGRIVWRSFEA